MVESTQTMVSRFLDVPLFHDRKFIFEHIY